MRRIGLTGGIGSGKSTVAAMLADLGASIIDADAISRDLTAAGGAAMPAIASAFGAGFVNASGALDREAMRKQVFSDPGSKRQLEAIIHPLVASQTAAQALSAAAISPRGFASKSALDPKLTKLRAMRCEASHTGAAKPLIPGSKVSTTLPTP
jgi:predicted ATPase